jgi:two-component system phosphate regulon sensor histidine kinase PhoR
MHFVNKIKLYIEEKTNPDHLSEAYYRKLLKATTLLSIVPTMVIAILIIYGRLNIDEGVFGFIAVLIGSIFFAKPYIDDLSVLTTYVGKLVMDHNVEMPSLSFLGSVEELSASVQYLHNSWAEKNLKLESAIVEGSIIFDTIPDLLMMLDHNMHIIRGNNAAKNIFGSNIEGIACDQIIKEPIFCELIYSVINNHQSKSTEISITSHNITREFQINIENFPLSNKSKIAVMLVMHDITNAKRTRQMIKDFVANASHEIRTPLTSIAGFIENLREMQEDKATRKKFLDIMHEQSERMSSLVNDLLSLSKAEINEGSAPVNNVQVSSLLKSTIRRVEHLAKAKSMYIDYKAEGKLPEVLGDENELSQLLSNLISNAIKYGYPDSKITVMACKQTERPVSDNYFFSSAKEVIAISVEDQGEGIAAEHIPRITERFYRVDAKRATHISGTGLGLAIVKHIINRHRGEMTITSIVGVGSVFTIYIPAVE